MSHVHMVELRSVCHRACMLMGLSAAAFAMAYQFAREEPDRAFRVYTCIVASFR